MNFGAVDKLKSARSSNRIGINFAAGIIATGLLSILWLPMGVYGKAITPPTSGGGGGGTTTLGTIEVVGVREFGPDTTGIPGINFVGGFSPGRDPDLFAPVEEHTTDPRTNGKKKCPTSGNPVVLATGNKIETETDFESHGEMGLRLDRIWNHHLLFKEHLFGAWTSKFDLTLQLGGCYPYPGSVECTGSSQVSLITAWRSDGSRISYSKASDGIWYSDKASPISKIILQSDGTWVLYAEDRSTEHYSNGGHILDIKNEQGIGWTFVYGGTNGTLLQRVNHSSGRYVEFTWMPRDPLTGAGPRVIQVKNPIGGLIKYTYTNDAYHRLQSTTLPGTPNTIITYHYAGEPGESAGNNFLVTGKSYNGVRYSTFSYGSDGTATGTFHAGNVEHFTYVYTVGAGGAMTVVETNPLGKVATYQFIDTNLVSITGKPSAHCASSYRELTYDATGYQNLVADFEGHITDFDYDAQGHLLKKVEAAGEAIARTTTYGWDIPKNRLIRETIVGLVETTYTYNAQGRIATAAVKNLSAKGVPGQVRTTTYTYAVQASSGLLGSVTIDGPLPGSVDKLVSTYNTTGDLVSTANGLNHITTYGSFNGLGEAGHVVGPNGNQTDFTYDAIGRVLTEKEWVNSAWQTTTYAYDLAGNLVSVQRPDGQKRKYLYDAAKRLTSESESEAGGYFAQTRYTYNNASLVTRIDTERVKVPPTGLVPDVAPNSGKKLSDAVENTGGGL